MDVFRRQLVAGAGAAALFIVAGMVSGCGTADCNDTATCPIVGDNALLAIDGALETNADIVGMTDRAGDATDDTVDSSDGSFETAREAADANDAAFDANDAAADAPPATETGVADADGSPDATIEAAHEAGPKCASNVLAPVAAVASSMTGNLASQAIDHDFTTRWESTQGIDPQWIDLDFGAPVFVNRVRIIWETACGKNYDLQTSNNTSTWITMRTITGNTLSNFGAPTDWSMAADHTGFTGVGRYLRINGTARCTMNYGYSIWEMQVYGDPNPACQP